MIDWFILVKLGGMGEAHLFKRLTEIMIILYISYWFSSRNVSLGTANTSAVMNTTMEQVPPRGLQRSVSASHEGDRRSGERDKLCGQIQHYKEIIKQQEQLIQVSLRNQ